MAEFERKSAISILTARVPVLNNLDILRSLNSALADHYVFGLARCSYSVREASSRLGRVYIQF